MKIAPLLLLLGGCSMTLAEADWPTALPEGACTVTVTRQDATGEWDLLRFYDEHGRVLGATTRLAYHGRGRELFEYDAAGRLVRIRSFDERDAEDFPCDAEGGCYTPPSREVVETTFEYDEAGRRTARTREDRRYLLDDGVYRRRRYEAYATRWERDGERLRAIHDGMGTTRFRWEDGRVVRIDREAHYPRHTTVEHDAEGRVARTRYETCTPEEECRVTAVTTFHYDDDGRLRRIEVVDPTGESPPGSTAWEYEGARLVRQTNDDGVRTHVLEYAYDASGRMLQVVEDGHLRERWRYEGRCGAVRSAPSTPTASRELGLDACASSPGYVLGCEG
ncbi:MAG: hypothetical protein KC619_28240 [Myxococcales bacterium]|nr:hypothetical protein [Myxococcales bacterium]